MSNKKLISIITVTLNAAQELDKTIRSVADQNKHNNIQHIIIDGYSNDKTLAVIKKQQDNISFWISEPDQGIYDAMNKGINLANCDWSIFINAGDTFANNSVLEKVFEYLNSDADVLYGDCILRYHGFNVLKKAGKLNDLWKGIIFSHQSVLIRTSVLKENKFNIDYKLGADFDQIYRLFKQKCKFKYIPIPISIVETEGVSNRKMLKSRFEQYKIIRNHKKLNLYQQSYYIFSFIYLLFISFLRLILPKKFYFQLVNLFLSKNIIDVEDNNIM